jgi:hypothetical protein
MDKSQGSIKKILYVIVMNEESSALLEKENFTKDETFTSEYSNILESFVLNKQINGADCQIIILRPIDDPHNKTGLFGTEIAFFLSYIGIKHYHPDLVVSLGYAGDTTTQDQVNERKLECGSVVIAREKSQYHRRTMIIKYFENTSQGNYPVHNCENMTRDLGFTHAYVGTSNSFVDHDDIAKSKSIKVVEMELCSVARGCSYFGIPCVGIKIISDSGSDIKDEKEREKQFLENLEILRKKFYETFNSINNYVLNKQVSEL